jgi:hypothetical protein
MVWKQYPGWLRSLLIGGLLVVSAGCGKSGDGRSSVTGKVTYDGQPLTNGQVVFEPGAQGRMAIGQVVDGRYTIAAERGPTAGDYTVKITSSRPTGEMAKGGPTSGDALREVHQQFLPEKYNVASELRVKIEPTDTSVERDFELKSQ